MAEKLCNLIKNEDGTSKYKVVATANANQTFGAQITQLSSAYNALTDGEKLHSALYRNGIIYFNMGGGTFSRTTVSAVHGQLIIYAIDINAYKMWQYTGTFTPAEITANTDTSVMSLILID